MLLSLLIQPENAKPDDFALPLNVQDNNQSLGMTFVDADRCFVHPFRREGKSLLPNTKSIVFCMAQMAEGIHPDVREQFANMDIIQVISGWIDSLEIYNKRLRNMFSNNEIIGMLNQSNQVVGFFKSLGFGRPEEQSRVRTVECATCIHRC
eukprot:TRINITY_DN1093_c0_g1_i3.p2 TRINITY_DN1093_c0_g1~~TRINITY_DN1093_c0_g1_i3.p2  ORF type:complete len:151 (-),score=48.81 TRINITY_DN1093_c0_g1_i3:254-706(-)